MNINSESSLLANDSFDSYHIKRQIPKKAWYYLTFATVCLIIVLVISLAIALGEYNKFKAFKEINVTVNEITGLCQTCDNTHYCQVMLEVNYNVDKKAYNSNLKTPLDPVLDNKSDAEKWGNITYPKKSNITCFYDSRYPETLSWNQPETAYRQVLFISFLLLIFLVALAIVAIAFWLYDLLVNRCSSFRSVYRRELGLSRSFHSTDSKTCCPVCQSRWRSCQLEVCKHEFCLVCIHKWVRKNKNCPLCRKDALLKDINLYENLPLV